LLHALNSAPLLTQVVRTPGFELLLLVPGLPLFAFLERLVLCNSRT
jgi:hypothetical protein